VKCNSTDRILFDPSLCLEDAGWSGYIYLVSDPNSASWPTLCQHQPSSSQGKKMSKQVISVVSVAEQSVSPIPEPVDVVAFSPLAGNCRLLVDMLSAESMMTAKLVHAPFNPTLPPPMVARPNFTRFQEVQKTKQVKEDSDAIIAQCSLTALAEDLSNLSYELLYVQHFFAVFVHRAFAPIFGLKLGHTAQQFEEWRLGWFCAPTSRYVLGLEAVAGFDFDTLPPTSSDSEALKSTVCRFFKRHQLSSADGHPSDDDDDCGNVKGRVQYSEKPPGSLKWSVERLRSVRWAQQQYQPVSAQLHLLESSGRAVCYKSGICDCLFPYRGHMCEEEDLTVSDKARNFRGAIHYIVNDDTQHILELEYALRNLEEMFNSKVDYPVLIFHDGLSAETRVRIVLQAPHRVWFFFVPDLVPDEIASARMATGNIGRTSEFGVGYIAQARFRSGPIFEHAGVQAFEYLWGLDSDSHIPNFIQSDPFQQIHSDPRNVMGYAHMTITSPTSVQTLWVHTVMYAMNNNIDLWSKKLRKWKDANMHFLALHLLGTPGRWKASRTGIEEL